MIEDSLTSFQKKLEFIQNSFQTRIAIRSYEIDKELQYLLKNELIKYTKQNQIPWVVDKNKILYCSDCIDYTDDFIKHLKRLKP